MNLHIKKFVEYIELCNVYYKECADDIARSNYIILRTLTRVTICIVPLFFGVSFWGFKRTELQWVYYVYFLFIVLFCLFITLFNKNKIPEGKLISRECALYNTALIIMVIFNYTFAKTTDSAAFIALIILFIPILFIFPIGVQFLMLFIWESLFIVFSLIFKPVNLMNNLFITISSVILAGIEIIIIYNIKLHDNRVRRELVVKGEIDNLTGLLNKSTTEELSREYFRTKKASEVCGLLILDIDDFKVINDGFGHQQGDYILSQVGMCLKSSCRENDILGRIGGDEFLMLLKDIPNEEFLDAKAKTIIQTVGKNFKHSGSLVVTCSIGGAASSEKIQFQELFSNADRALYQSKQNGKNQSTIRMVNNCDKPKILIADDSEISRAALICTLEDEYSVVEASDGLEALNIIRKQGMDLEAVLLDLEMPRMNGYDLMEEMKNDGKLRTIPVLVITIHAEGELQALELGADDIILKPFDPMIVRKRVENVCNRKYRI